jgi:hypothetical protein
MSASCDSPVPDLARELADVSTEPCRKPKGHELPHKNEAGVMWTPDYVGHLSTRDRRPRMDIVMAPKAVAAYLTKRGLLPR